VRKFLCCLSLLVVFSPGPVTGDEDLGLQGLKVFARSLEATESVRMLNPADAASVLGRDLDAILNFVRDEITFEPYQGALRGGSGALLARAGNSFDQALLLKEMLDAAGIRSRIARGELSREDAAKLVASIQPAFLEVEILGKAEMERLGISAEKFSIEWPKHADLIGGLVKDTVSAAREDLEALKLPGSAPAPDLVEISRDYYWVQILSGDASYDLHPAFAKGEAPRLAPTAVVNNIASVPSHLFHWVNLRVFGERIDGGDLVRFKLLEKKILPAAVAGKTVTFSLRAKREGESVSLQPAVKAGELILSGDRIGVSAGDGAPKDGALTALWLEVGILSPAERPRITTITLADTLAPRQPVAEGDRAPKPQRSLTLEEMSLSVEMAVVSGRVDYRAMLGHGARQAEWFCGLLAADAEEKAAEVTLAGFPAENPILLHWSAILGRAWAEALPGTRLYPNAPLVVCAVYLPTKSGDRFELKSAIGILHLRTMSSNRSPGDSALGALIASRLLAGVARLHSTDSAEVVSALPSAKVEAYKAVTRDGLSRRNLAGWDRQTLLELEDDLLRRHAALVPAADGATPEFWWRVAPGSADPVARGPAGWPVWLSGGEYISAGDDFITGEMLRAASGLSGTAISPAEIAAAFARHHLLAAGASPFTPMIKTFSEKLTSQLGAALGKPGQ